MDNISVHMADKFLEEYAVGGNFFYIRKRMVKLLS